MITGVDIESFEHSRPSLMVVDRGADRVGRQTSGGGGKPDPLETPAGLDPLDHAFALDRQQADRGGGWCVLIDIGGEEMDQSPASEQAEHFRCKQSRSDPGLPAP